VVPVGWPVRHILDKVVNSEVEFNEGHLLGAIPLAPHLEVASRLMGTIEDFKEIPGQVGVKLKPGLPFIRV
jgi:hypothetical protein